jgi:hypothetical protein
MSLPVQTIPALDYPSDNPFVVNAPSGSGSGGGSRGGLAGTGSPQGVVTAPAGTTYVDTATDNFWVNTTGTNTGWVPLIESP